MLSSIITLEHRYTNATPSSKSTIKTVEKSVQPVNIFHTFFYYTLNE